MEINWKLVTGIFIGGSIFVGIAGYFYWTQCCLRKEINQISVTDDENRKLIAHLYESVYGQESNVHWQYALNLASHKSQISQNHQNYQNNQSKIMNPNTINNLAAAAATVMSTFQQKPARQLQEWNNIPKSQPHEENDSVMNNEMAFFEGSGDVVDKDIVDEEDNTNDTGSVVNENDGTLVTSQSKEILPVETVINADDLA